MNQVTNMKYCKKCRALIPFKAQKCQFCGKRQQVDTSLIVVGIISAFFVLLLAIGNYNDSSNTGDNQSQQQEENTNILSNEETQTEYYTESLSGSENKEEVEETQINPPKELTEDEYKKQCAEKYYDDFFIDTPDVGEFVKIYAFTSEKYKYYSGDMRAILVEDITEQYNLKLNSLGCCVLHEETKDDVVPSYFGKHIYIMFSNGGDIKFDDLKTGKRIIIYGKVIQNVNGIYILPKYIEEE